MRDCEHLYCPVVVLGERYFGFHNGTRFCQNVSELDAFLSHAFVSIAFLSRTTADRFVWIASQLQRAGTPIPTNDMWIAAQSMELGSELISFDEHFERIPGLVLVYPTS